MERQGNPAVKWGLIFGGALLLLGLINFGIQYASGSFDPNTTAAAVRTGRFGPLLALGCLFFLLEVGIFLLAGMLTARENGRVGSAAIAGMIAGLVYAVIASVVEVLTLNNTLSTLPTANPERLHSAFIVIAIIIVVLVFVFAGGIGAGIAALGGLIGRSQYERSHPAPLMQGSYYTPMPPNGGYPPAGASQPAYPPTYYPPYPPNQSASYPPPNPPAQPTDYPPNPPQPPAQQ